MPASKVLQSIAASARKVEITEGFQGQTAASDTESSTPRSRSPRRSQQRKKKTKAILQRRTDVEEKPCLTNRSPLPSHDSENDSTRYSSTLSQRRSPSLVRDASPISGNRLHQGSSESSSDSRPSSPRSGTLSCSESSTSLARQVCNGGARNASPEPFSKDGGQERPHGEVADTSVACTSKLVEDTRAARLRADKLLEVLVATRSHSEGGDKPTASANKQLEDDVMQAARLRADKLREHLVAAQARSSLSSQSVFEMQSPAPRSKPALVQRLSSPSSPCAKRPCSSGGPQFPNVATSSPIARSPSASPRCSVPMSPNGFSDSTLRESPRDQRQRMLEQLTTQLQLCLNRLQDKNLPEDKKEAYQTLTTSLRAQMDKITGLRVSTSSSAMTKGGH